LEAFRQCGSFCVSFCAFSVFDYIIGPTLTRMETIDLRDSYDHDFVAAIRCDDWLSQAKVLVICIDTIQLNLVDDNVLKF
jgi:hypothetical protein